METIQTDNRKEVEYLYRVFNSGIYVCVERHEITKETRCGYWIRVYGSQKFVLKESEVNPGKRFAFRTEKAAMASFKARKLRQIKILTRQIQDARAALEQKTITRLYK